MNKLPDELQAIIQPIMDSDMSKEAKAHSIACSIVSYHAAKMQAGFMIPSGLINYLIENAKAIKP